MFRRHKRTIPELNTTSTADISFMLLIFFLVTTSMDTDKGLTRQLPPETPTEEQVEDHNIQEGKLLRLKIDNHNQVICGDEPLSIKELRNKVKEFVTKAGRDHVIQLEADRQASYDTYFAVQNEMVAAYHVLRDEKAQRDYGYSFEKCTEEQKNQLRTAIPQRISEIYVQEKGGER